MTDTQGVPGQVEVSADTLPSHHAEGGQGHMTSFGSSEKAVAASTQGRCWDTGSGNHELLPGFVLGLPDPGCASYLTLFVSQGHYRKSGENDGTELTGFLWGLNE